MLESADKLPVLVLALEGSDDLNSGEIERSNDSHLMIWWYVAGFDDILYQLIEMSRVKDSRLVGQDITLT